MGPYVSPDSKSGPIFFLVKRHMIWYDIYLTAIGLTPGGSITRHIYNKQYTQYIESTIL